MIRIQGLLRFWKIKVRCLIVSSRKASRKLILKWISIRPLKSKILVTALIIVLRSKDSSFRVFQVCRLSIIILGAVKILKEKVIKAFHWQANWLHRGSVAVRILISFNIKSVCQTILMLLFLLWNEQDAGKGQPFKGYVLASRVRLAQTILALVW